VVIEDAAQAVGAELDGRPVGSFGSFGILSFGRGKGLTGGGGGALLCNDERAELLVRAPGIVRQLNVGAKGIGELIRATAQWMLARPSIYAVPQALPFLALGETVYHEPSEPRRMSTIATAVLNEVWERSHAAVDVRRRNATRLLSTVKASKAFVAVNVSSHADPGYLRLPVLAASREIAHDSQRQARIGVIRGYPMPLPQLHAAHTCCVNCNEKFPGAALLAEQLITLPTHGLLNENDLRALERWLATFGTATRILDAPAKSPSY
jgi:perosamine synthetase